MERYIPSKSSYNTYHAYKRHSMPNIRQKRVWNFGQRSTTSSENTPEVKYTGPIANALGFTHKKRVLRFIARTKPINRGLGQLQAQDTPESNPKEPQYSPSKSQVKTLFPHTVLDAPGLRNDFYSNLISWSGSSGKVAVGLGSQVYLWSEPEGAVLLPVTKNESISVVSFSSLDWLVVGTKRGTISLYSQESGTILAEFTLLDNAICCICWVPDSNVGFYLGDETGLVYYFAIEIYGDEYKLELATSFKSHQQQICGMDISNDGKILAVGGNDNSCAVWSIQDLIQPELKYCLGHQAAVKAVAFCPWSTTLLATGGGSKDRTIRFWHTNSGTLLHKMNTKSQITALVWSRSKKQLVATFGFGNTVDPLLLMVYSYPNLKPLSKVTGSPNLRALSTISSPDFKSICVAANDQNVRFYKVWSSEPRAIPEYSESSMLGSEIIELSEGIDKQREIIR